MIRIFIVSILLIFVTIGCESSEVNEEFLKPEPMDEKPEKLLTYLALGDSYTIGEGVSENERYPVQLQETLAEAGVHLQKVQIVARTGWTADELSRAMLNVEFDDSYGLVTLLIGVNNQYRGYSPESFRPEFIDLLNQAILLAGNSNSRVVVLSIPDWGVTPFAQGRNKDKIASEIDEYNAITKQEAQNAGVAWIDITAISRQAPYRPEFLSDDHLHPSAIMYKLWIKELFPIALEIFKEN